MDIKSLKEEAKALEPLIRVGKDGLTEGTIKEIKKMLEKRKMIKIKMLRAFFEGKDKKEIANEIAVVTDSVLVDRVGFVVVLHKRV